MGRRRRGVNGLRFRLCIGLVNRLRLRRRCGRLGHHGSRLRCCRLCLGRGYVRLGFGFRYCYHWSRLGLSLPSRLRRFGFGLRLSFRRDLCSDRDERRGLRLRLSLGLRRVERRKVRQRFGLDDRSLGGGEIGHDGLDDLRLGHLGRQVGHGDGLCPLAWRLRRDGQDLGLLLRRRPLCRGGPEVALVPARDPPQSFDPPVRASVAREVVRLLRKPNQLDRLAEQAHSSEHLLRLRHRTAKVHLTGREQERRLDVADVANR